MDQRTPIVAGAAFAVVLIGGVLIWQSQTSEPPRPRKRAEVEAESEEETKPRPPRIATAPRRTSPETYQQALAELPFEIGVRSMYKASAPRLAGFMHHTGNWADVESKADIAEAAKDAQGHLRESVCGVVFVGMIRKVPEFSFALYDASFLAGATNVKAIVIGNTAGIVTGTQARFCGVVVGQDPGPLYQLHLVGMFDTPANRTKP